MDEDAHAHGSLGAVVGDRDVLDGPATDSAKSQGRVRAVAVEQRLHTFTVGGEDDRGVGRAATVRLENAGP